MKYIPILIIAVLHGISAITNVRLNHIGPWTMLLGSILIILGSIQGIRNNTTEWWLLLGGLVLIIDSAIYNGYKQGHIHWVHHGIRMMLCVVAVLPLFH
ncbi:hypothetical protein G7061_01520 [Erysipelothrix sp. HDW6B]|uniref:hypothetical protein n=1 Tax=Erysipelothrix sp. HDW6B TaxID=2714929 RepID=UPI00140CD719|nr:hypothetical protein [Erysipelothrix sp. HDW6B]QIK85375.1 hypothetical protein G7061_01520 [Erysipelothrix sp. HDW6B]